MRLVLILLSVLALALPAFAQEDPPLPRPRPQRDSTGKIVSVPAPAGNGGSGATVIPGGNAADALKRFAGGPPQALTLSAKISEDGPVVPEGLVWRIYDTNAIENGQLKLLGKSDDATSVFTLAPGRYVIHVAYGHTQASDTVTITDQPSARVMVLEAGGLKLNGAITGDVEIPPALLSFDIYSGETDTEGGTPLVANVHSGELVQLNAGVYHIVSKFGGINAVVRADLRVEPGQLTDATLFPPCLSAQLPLGFRRRGRSHRRCRMDGQNGRRRYGLYRTRRVPDLRLVGRRLHGSRQAGRRGVQSGFLRDARPRPRNRIADQRLLTLSRIKRNRTC